MKNIIKKMHTHLVNHCLQVVHLMQQKINLIITKVRTAWKGFVKM